MRRRNGNESPTQDGWRPTDQLPAKAANRGIIEFRATSGGNITGMGLRMNPPGGFTSIPKLPSPR